MTDPYKQLREALEKGLAERRTERDYYDYIAAANPQAIAALLAERDALTDALVKIEAIAGGKLAPVTWPHIANIARAALGEKP